MAYTINGKVYTEHPLMDEMIYNLNIIMKNIEVKNEEMALSYETGETLEASDIYLSIVGGHATYTTFPMTKKMLELYGLDSYTAQQYIDDRNTIPISDREAIMKFCCNYFVENYYENNNYYRALIGLPWISEYEPEETYYVYIDETFVKEPTLVKEINFDKPLHEYSDYQIAILQSLGQMERIWNMYPSKEYKYLRFLGDRRRDLYTVRHAAKWDILYMPAVEQLVSDRWRQLYEVNRVLGLKREYSEAYKLKSTYYEETMIILLLCQTYTDMIVDIPEWYIRRDIFDLRTCKYFLESHGIEFFKIIPLKFQILLVKNMNKLIRYKSTDKNIFDIIDLFTRDEVTVYKHHMFKRRKVNLDGSYVNTGNPDEDYELMFVRTPIGDTFDNTIKDESNIFRYDDITYADKYWDGQDYHEVVKDWHMGKQFTIEGTKYYSMDYKVSYSEYSKQIRYFLGIILDSDMDLSEIKINVSSISSVISFGLTDLFILLYCLTALYDEYNLVIRTPVNNTYMQKPELEIYEDIDGYDPDVEDYGGVIEDIDGNNPTVKRRFRRPIEGGYDPEETELNSDSFYDWLRYKYPYLWLDMSNRIYGFNMDADLDLLAKLVGFRHSTYKWARGYTLEEIGVSNFIVTKKIRTIDQFVKIYENNIEIHDKLMDKILNANTKDEQVVFQFVYDYLFTKNFDYKRYTLPSTGKLANTYDEVLKEKNYILYKHYIDIKAETDKDTRRDMIRQTMNDIVNTLEYYLNFDYIRYIFSSFTISSFDSIIKYIWLNINFFKSYKVYFLDPYVNFKMDNKFDNTLTMIDQISETKINYAKEDKYSMSDGMAISAELNVSDEDEHPSGAIETLEVYGYYEQDPSLDLECNGGNLREENWKFLDLDGGGVEEHENTINIDGKHPLRSIYEKHQPFSLPYDVYGGTPETEVERDIHDSSPIFREFGVVDGGGVPIISCCPFNPWNGGRAGAGLLMFDLNGSYDYNQNYYLNINGKVPEEEMYKHTPQKSFYEIDGGHPDFNTFYKPSMVVRIIDDQISADARLAADYKRKPNEITILNDGLYVEDKYGSQYTVDTMEIELDDMIDRYRVLFNDSLDQIEFSSNKDKLNKFIIDVVVDEIAIYNKQYFEAVERIEVTREEINKYTDEQAEYLETLFHDWNAGLALSNANWGEF